MTTPVRKRRRGLPKRISVTVTRDRVPEVMDAIEELTRRWVLIGVSKKTNAREDGPTGNAEIGMVNEFGSPAQNIPPRPHLVPGVRAALPDAGKILRAAARKALRGDMSEIEKGFRESGALCVSRVRGEIIGGLDKPLSPSTIEQRKEQGRGGTLPLLDTKQYINAMTFDVVDKE